MEPQRPNLKRRNPFDEVPNHRETVRVKKDMDAIYYALMQRNKGVPYKQTVHSSERSGRYETKICFGCRTPAETRKCDFCTNPTCNSCQQTCENPDCGGTGCGFCLVTNYDLCNDRIFCLSCDQGLKAGKENLTNRKK